MENVEPVVEVSAKERSMAARIFCGEDGRTQQHFKEECDINTIVRRYGITGLVPVGTRAPSFGDFTGVMDYQTALNAVMEAEKAFGAIPADIRKRFDNDPQAFVAFCSDKANVEEMEKLGLVHSFPPVDREPPLGGEGSDASGAKPGA